MRGGTPRFNFLRLRKALNVNLTLQGTAVPMSQVQCKDWAAHSHSLLFFAIF